MTFEQTNFWLQTLTDPPAYGDQPWPAQVDVAVIGAGLTGLSAARALARQGASVAVLETHAIGWGASSRNGGMVLTGLKVGADSLVARYGRDQARQLFAASLAAINCVEQIVRAEQIDCSFSRSGHLEVATKRAHFKGFVRAAEAMQREFQHSVRVVPPGELDAEIGSDAFHGGLVDEASAGLNPARYTAGLAAAAARAGAALYPQTPVEKVEAAGSLHKLRTGRGALLAKDVVVATSGYTGRATPALQRRIVPIGSYIIATDVLPELLAREVSPRNRMIFDSKHFLHYFRLTPDRRMLFGGRAAFFPETPSTVRESAALLHKTMLRFFPQLAAVPVAYAWGGTLDFAFDLMPHTGQLDGLWHALGYAGHGVALATYLGDALAGAISGSTEPSPFASLPFRRAPLGLYDGRPWFLPLAEVWYKLLDTLS
jgi:glycine/D-amino acid oxidase-like deaminating enzyme